MKCVHVRQVAEILVQVGDEVSDKREREAPVVFGICDGAFERLTERERLPGSWSGDDQAFPRRGTEDRLTCFRPPLLDLVGPGGGIIAVHVVLPGVRR